MKFIAVRICAYSTSISVAYPGEIWVFKHPLTSCLTGFQKGYIVTVHIGYSDNAGGIDFWAKLSLYPISYVWTSWRRGFIPRDNNINISLYPISTVYIIRFSSISAVF